VTWISLGGADLELVDKATPLGEPGFAATYQQTVGRYVAISHSLLDQDLRGVNKLSFMLASTNDANIMVYLEEKKPGAVQGPRYSRLVAVRGGGRPMPLDLDLSAFQRDGSSPVDPDGKLSGVDLKSISLIDITAADVRPSKPNTLWISAGRVR
jgi:hypothetical protein